MCKLLKSSLLGIAVIAMLTVSLSMVQTQSEKLMVGWSAVSALNAPYWVMRDALSKEGGTGSESRLHPELIDDGSSASFR